jgi:hypothetical protein
MCPSLEWVLAHEELTDAQRQQCLRDLEGINERIEAYLS